jgi:hypothetical protein
MNGRRGIADGPSEALRRVPGALLLLTIGVAAFGLALVVDTVVQHAGREVPFYRAPEFFPVLSLLIVGLGALAMSFRHLRHGPAHMDEALPRTRPRPLVVVAIAIAFAGYILITPWLGYPASTALFVAVGLKLSGRSTVNALLLALVTASLLWLIFPYLLGTWFPSPRLLDLLAGG